MELITRLKKRGNVMYLVDKEAVIELDNIQKRIHCDLGRFLKNVFVSEFNTKLFNNPRQIGKAWRSRFRYRKFFKKFVKKC